jgi:hypothetical protein
LERVALVDLKPVKLTPMWRNRRMGEARITKRLDLFLVSEDVLDEVIQIIHFVSTGGESNYNLVILEVTPTHGKPPNPFKMNLEWMKDGEFVNTIKDSWKPFDDSLN